MNIPLKTKIAFWWWKKSNLRKTKSKDHKISKTGDGLRSIFIILPRDKTHLSIAQHFIMTISDRGNFAAINKIIGWEEQRNLLNSELLQRTQLINENDLDKFGLLISESLKAIKNGQFTAIINLDPELNPLAIQIVNSFKSEIKIGFSTTEDIDIYNINIDNYKSNNFVEKGYKYILEVLGL
jgi:hypothetical protein